MRKKFIRFWFPLILYSGIIFYVSSLPNLKAPLPDIHFDSILHVMLYGPFGYLAARAVSSVKSSPIGRKLILLILLMSMVYGASDEYHQSLIVGRDAQWLDLLADTIGGTLGCLFYQTLNSSRMTEAGKN